MVPTVKVLATRFEVVKLLFKFPNDVFILERKSTPLSEILPVLILEVLRLLMVIVLLLFIIKRFAGQSNS